MKKNVFIFQQLKSSKKIFLKAFFKILTTKTSFSLHVIKDFVAIQLKKVIHKFGLFAI